MIQETNGKDEELTGSDIPGGTGEISDEDLNAIDDGCGKNAATGQDHSTENHAAKMPDSLIISSANFIIPFTSI